jgi:basic amino acid/polyamine antiporter, APA family
MQVTFRRELGLFDAAMVVVGAIIGAGIFINPYLVAQRLGGFTPVLLAWVAGGVLALLGSLSYAELGALFPRAGGQYVYLRDAWHPLAGFLYGWALLAIIETGAIAAVSLAFAEYTLRALGRSMAHPEILAALAIVAVSVVNYLGVKLGSRLLNLFVILKVAALVALIAVGLFGSGPAAASPAAAGASSPRATWSLFAFGAALVPILFSYGGWQNLNYITEELREPLRTLPRALVLGASLVVLVYVLVNLAYLRVLGVAGLAATTTPASATLGAAFGTAGDRLAAGAIAISTFGFLNLGVLAPSRVYYAMAADGALPRSMARLHPRFRTPTVAIGVQSAWTITLALTGTYAQLLDSVVFADWIFFGSTVAGIFVFRRRLPVHERTTFRDPAYPIGPAVFVLAAAGVVASVIASAPRQAAMGTLLLATGVPVYLFFTRRRS